MNLIWATYLDITSIFLCGIHKHLIVIKTLFLIFTNSFVMRTVLNFIPQPVFHKSQLPRQLTKFPKQPLAQTRNIKTYNFDHVLWNKFHIYQIIGCKQELEQTVLSRNIHNKKSCTWFEIWFCQTVGKSLFNV